MDDLIEKGTLQHGLKIVTGDGLVEFHKEFEMGPIESMGQMFDAEAEADVGRPLLYRGALMAQQLRRVGTFTGPFTLSMIRNLKPVDFNILRTAQNTLDRKAAELGKPESED